MPNLLVVLLAMVFVTQGYAQDCAAQSAKFDSFLRKYNPWTHGPKATLATIRAEFGQPTTLEPQNTGFIYAKYDFGACVGVVTIDREGFLIGASVDTKSTPISEPTISDRLSEIDRQIADLQTKLSALQEIKQALKTVGNVSTAPARTAAIAAQAPLPSESYKAATYTVRQAVQPGTITVQHLAVTPNLVEGTTARMANAPAQVAIRADGYPDREYTIKDQNILTGPRGGRYHYSSSGKKVYERRNR